MKKKNVSLLKIIGFILIILLVIGIIYGVSKKISSDSEKKVKMEISAKEDEIIQHIREAFNEARNEFIIKEATTEDYKPNYLENDNGGNLSGSACDLKNIVVSALGKNVIDESKMNLSSISLKSYRRDFGKKVDELNDGYHVFLSNGDEESIKFITIIYKDSTFCHGVAYYDTENNIVIDNADNNYPILIAQIRLTDDDVSYYLEPIKSVK